MTVRLLFTAWRRFAGTIHQPTIAGFLAGLAKASERAFKRGIRSPKSGNWYYGRSKRSIQASAPGQYPAIDTGDLDASISTRTTIDSVTIGTNVFYAKFLREGTRKMARRKMSDNALSEGISTSRHKLAGFARWTRR